MKLVKNQYGRYGYNALIHETKGNITHTYTNWVDAYPNVSNEMYRKLNNYLNNLEVIKLSFEEYKKDAELKKVNGTCLAIEPYIKNEFAILSYLNVTENIKGLLSVLDYLLRY